MRNNRSRSLTKEYCRYEQCAKRSLIAQEIPPERHREKEVQHSSSRGCLCTQRPLERKPASLSEAKRAQELFALEVSLNFSAMMCMIKAWRSSI